MTLFQNIAIENTNLLIPILIWSLIWKGIALWKAGRNNQIRWFVAILIINTAGLLEIVYLLWLQKKREK
ncbi:hypothetical protein COY07_03025 [Candidatus Peregrinibacteria bacterium CG_4_10_14_0_2_um_filter_43_11]|nr:MAG: hypothetical protein COY07_03025 [Candidatus Peregrinibacteria bacterium CG_4_10_14_0_2_um_filter_43_11]